MSVRQNGKIIAGNAASSASLFDHKWADHILNDISWLRADTFSWHSGDVYKAAYEHLLDDYENREEGDTVYRLDVDSDEGEYLLNYYVRNIAVGEKIYNDSGGPILGVLESVSSDEYNIYTIVVKKTDGTSTEYSGFIYKHSFSTRFDEYDDFSVEYYLAKDGHKICRGSSSYNTTAENAVKTAYEATGVAWYYLLDTTNKQFKLPRTKYGFVGMRDGVGNYVPESLPNFTLQFDAESSDGYNTLGGMMTSKAELAHYGLDGGNRGMGVYRYTGSASSVSSTYKDGAPVQQRATQSYLYFYVGNYVKNQDEIDAGKLTEIVNDFDPEQYRESVNTITESSITDINDARSSAISSVRDLAEDIGTSLKYANVGDIFYTTRLDSSLNGAVEANGAAYNTTDFSGPQSIGNLLTDGKIPHVTIADFDIAVANSGECTSFGWDGGTVFRVPKVNGRRLVRRQLPTTDNNYTWYNLYSDGYVEQGGQWTHATGTLYLTLPVAMASNEFSVIGSFGKNYAATNNNNFVLFAYSTTQICLQDNNTGTMIWQVSGYAAESEYNDKSTWQYDRYMRPMVQLAFGATDESVVMAGSVVADISELKTRVGELESHTLVDFQLPTEENGYVWYKRYADGWVEQGGLMSRTSSGVGTVTLPIEMADTGYLSLAVLKATSISGSGGSWANCNNASTTTIQIVQDYATTWVGKGSYWLVIGMSAQ